MRTETRTNVEAIEELINLEYWANNGSHTIKISGITFDPAAVLKTMDPIAYDQVILNNSDDVYVCEICGTVWDIEDDAKECEDNCSMKQLAETKRTALKEFKVYVCYYKDHPEEKIIKAKDMQDLVYNRMGKKLKRTFSSAHEVGNPANDVTQSNYEEKILFADV